MEYPPTTILIFLLRCSCIIFMLGFAIRIIMLVGWLGGMAAKSYGYESECPEKLISCLASLEKIEEEASKCILGAPGLLF